MKSTLIVLITISLLGLKAQDNGFMLKRLQFQQEVGWWMSEELYSFAVLRTEQAESYEVHDLLENARRIFVQDEIIKARGKEVDELKRLLSASKGIRDGQAMTIERVNGQLQAEVRRRKVNNVLGWSAIALAFGGGVFLGSR